MHESSS